MIHNLKDLIELFRREGELIEVNAAVDPKLELAEVHRRVIAANGPAILFKNPIGADFPVLTNVFGSARRVELALGRGAQDF